MLGAQASPPADCLLVTPVVTEQAGAPALPAVRTTELNDPKRLLILSNCKDS